MSVCSAVLPVTPLAGVWIEIVRKYYQSKGNAVTPLAGVWIEIREFAIRTGRGSGHSPCGSVD